MESPISGEMALSALFFVVKLWTINRLNYQFTPQIHHFVKIGPAFMKKAYKI
jgi:hypothetical protein